MLGDIPERALPEIRPSCAELGTTRDGALPGFDGVPVAGVAGDQQAALVGQACLEAGAGQNTYGTGSLVLLHPGGGRAPPARGALGATAAAARGGPALRA